MKKAFSIILSAILMVISLTIGTAFAADDKNKNVPSAKEIVSELEKYETPYYGENFDFNNDGTVNVFDIIALRKKLISGENGITIATAVKLNRWLLGKDTTLGISEFADSLVYPHETDTVKNLLSNDFRFVDIYEGHVHLDGDTTPAVILCFLGKDEYILEHIFVYNFCNSSDEFDEFVAEGTGYSIGVKNQQYALALSANTSEGNEKSTTLEISTEDKTEKSVSEKEIDLSLIEYDLTKPNLSTAEVIQTLDEVSNSLNAAPYSFTINKIGSDKIELSGKSETSEINIIVHEFEPVKETSILESDDFHLFYDNTQGFGLLVK